MTGKPPSEREALERLSAQLLKGFQAAGHEHIEPDILQPADVFLDRSGEDIRSRTFVFTSPDGRELCLRPDLTVPACRYHLERHGDAPDSEARYCYAGPAFRYQGPDAGPEHPQEFLQCGLEWFAASDADAAEADIVATVLASLREAGLTDFTVTAGDLKLFHSLLRSLDMPGRWRRRLKHHFWRPRAFRSLLQHLSGERRLAQSSLSPLLDRLDDGKLETALALVESELAARDAPLVGGRTATDIAERLAEKAADRIAAPLNAADAAAIDDYLAIRAPLDEAEGEIDRMARRIGGAFAETAERFKRRNRLFAERGLDPGTIEFAAVFGRSLEYYTGFVFQVETRPEGGVLRQVAGGGRYDDMISDIGGGEPVPALGCAIHAQRLLAALREAS